MRGRQIRSFLVILGLTSLVWLGMAMSETKEYNLPVKVSFSGFDTKRFAVVGADTSMTLQVESTGFNAFIFSLNKKMMTFEVDIKNEAVHRYTRHRGDVVDIHRTVAIADLSAQLSSQLFSYGIRHLGSTKDSLALVLNERGHKVFRPDLANLRINFSDGFGLYGEPMVSPTEVTLYGSPEVLSAIESVGVKPMTLNDVRETGTYRVPLDGKWKEMGDVYASSDVLTINIPVKRYVERQYSVPVTVADADSTQNLHLYPERVTLHVWVAQENVATVSADRFSVSADYRDIEAGSQRLKLHVDRFPRDVRIRSVEPEEVEYVIIK